MKGSKAPLRTDESYLYWTPAPAKWDATPAQVKKELFPQYHGAALAQDVESTMVGGGISTPLLDCVELNILHSTSKIWLKLSLHGYKMAMI